MNQTIITVGRQFGAGGRDIAKRLSQALDVPYYDKELLAEAAKISGLCQQYLEKADETSTNSLLFSLVMGRRNLTGQPTLEEMTWNAHREAVRQVAGSGGCVIVGRCADVILNGNPHLFRVFLTADEDWRIARVSLRDNISSEEAKQKIHRMEKSRSAYYRNTTDQIWGSAANYDLCLNVSKLGTENVVQMILDASAKTESQS